MSIPRFRIRTLMIAVAVVGGVLGLARTYPGLAFWFIAWCSMVIPPLLLSEFAVRFRNARERGGQASFPIAFTLILLVVCLIWIFLVLLVFIMF